MAMVTNSLRRAAAAALVAATTLAVQAARADDYQIDVRHTFPVFEVSHLGISLQRGRFNKVAGKVSIDPAASRGALEITVDAASIDMGFEDWNRQMRSEEWFDTDRFPTLVFKGDRFEFRDGKPVAVDGTLTLLGVTRPLRLTIAGFGCTLNPFNKRTICGADIEARLRRSDFGMTRSLRSIGDEVVIRSPVEATRVEP